MVSGQILRMLRLQLLEYFILLKKETVIGETSDNRFDEISDGWIKISYFDSVNFCGRAFVVVQKNRSMSNAGCFSINFLAVGCRCVVSPRFRKE